MTATIWVTQTLHEFGRMLGIDELAFDEQGTVQLAFEQLGVLELECAGDSTLVCLKRSLRHPDAQTYRRALEICHYDETDFDWLQAALIGEGQLALATRIPHENFQLSNLEQIVTTLGDLHDRLTETVA